MSEIGLNTSPGISSHLLAAPKTALVRRCLLYPRVRVGRIAINVIHRLV